MTKINIHNVVKLSEFSDWVSEKYDNITSRIAYHVIVEKLKYKDIRIFYLKDIQKCELQEHIWIVDFLNYFKLDNIAFYLDLDEN